VEFVKLFELAGDQTGGGGIAALPPDLKEVREMGEFRRVHKLRLVPFPPKDSPISFIGK